MAKDSAGGLDTVIWNSRGKIKKILMQDKQYTSLKDSLLFNYNPMGQRVMKIFYGYSAQDSSLPIADTTIYSRDAQGNVLAVYQQKDDSLWAKEWIIYGSDRIGMLKGDSLLWTNGLNSPQPGDSSYLIYGALDIIHRTGINVAGDGTITDISGMQGFGFSGGATQQSITGDGYVQYTLGSSNNDLVLLGLSAGYSGNNPSDIQYGWYTDSYVGEMIVGENGYIMGNFGSYTNGTVLRVERQGNQILYYKDGVLKYTSQTTPTTDTMITTFAIFTDGSKIYDLTMGEKIYTNTTHFWEGNKRYELTNHLGNVMATVSDHKVYNTQGNYFQAVLKQAQDYYPFGMLQPGRHFSSDTYRFGFNGQEKENEVYGNGNSYTAPFWQYDARLGRRWNLDPKPTVSISSYATFADNPILFSDIFGDTLFIGGKINASLKDIRSLIPKEYRSMIQKTDDNRILFEGYKNLTDKMKKYEGVSLLHKLVSVEEKYEYKVGIELIGKNRETGETAKLTTGDESIIKNDPTAQGAILNFSTTERTDIKKLDDYNSLPKVGFSGSVLIENGTFSRPNSITHTGDFPIKRNTIVFHELLENYLRTEKGKDYKGDNGAHQGAINKGNKFSKEVNGKRDRNSGVATGFKKHK